MTEIPERIPGQLQRAIPATVRSRLVAGHVESGADVTTPRRFIGLTQEQFAAAMGISVRTFRNRERGRRHLVGPAIALIRIAARHPRVILENVRSVA